ncbi:hypothetical protein ADL35_32985 [Streptomyces sp. NRRL WC-3753]|nr:hypothetical protein ADL35_32985 [Streptomyces sp. NRRL WC-3753]
MGRLPIVRLDLADLRSWTAATAGGFLLYASFPPLGLWFLAPLGPALLIIAVRGRRARSAFTAGGVFGTAFLAPLILWLANLGVLPWLALTAVQAVIFALAALLLPRLTTQPGWPLYTAAWWVALEAIRGRVPLGGFPWGRLAFGQADAPYAGWAAVGGGPTLSFAVAFLGSLLVYGLTAWRDGRRPMSAAVGLGTVVLITAPLTLPAPDRSGPSAVVALVQGNAERQRTLEEQARVRGVAKNHARETKALADAVRRGDLPRPDVVLWPENSLDGDPERSPGLGSLVADSVRELNSPLLVGALLEAPGGRAYNAGQLWLPGQGPVSWYAKRQLVPFGEYIPARPLLGRFGALQLVPRDLLPGTSTDPLVAGKVWVGDVICYEIAYDDRVRDTVRAGANLLVVQTNNATYERALQAGQSEQQLAMARIRAIEYGRAVALVSTSGVSAIVAPDGQVLARLGTWRGGHLVERVPLVSGLTLSEWLGVWPEVLLAVPALVGLTLTFRRSRRTPTNPRADANRPERNKPTTNLLS